MNEEKRQAVVEKWLHDLTVSAVERERRKVERAILNHFGTAERAEQLASLFPGRYQIRQEPRPSFAGLFGMQATTEWDYRLVDTWRPVAGEQKL